MAGAKRTRPRNYMLGNSGIMRWSGSSSFSKKAKYKFAKPGQKKAAKVEAKPKTIVKQIGGEKNGGTRVVAAKKTVSDCIPSFRALVVAAAVGLSLLLLVVGVSLLLVVDAMVHESLITSLRV